MQGFYHLDPDDTSAAFFTDDGLLGRTCSKVNNQRPELSISFIGLNLDRWRKGSCLINGVLGSWESPRAFGTRSARVTSQDRVGYFWDSYSKMKPHPLKDQTDSILTDRMCGVETDTKCRADCKAKLLRFLGTGIGAIRWRCEIPDTGESGSYEARAASHGSGSARVGMRFPCAWDRCGVLGRSYDVITKWKDTRGAACDCDGYGRQHPGAREPIFWNGGGLPRDPDRRQDDCSV
jgi:hypothetical protein